MVLFWFCFGFIQQQHLAVIAKKNATTADYSDILLWDRMEAAAQNATNDYPGDRTWQTKNVSYTGGRVNNGITIADSESDGDDWAREPIANNDIVSTTEGTIYIEFKIGGWVDNAKFFYAVDDSSGYGISIQAAGTDEIEMGWWESGLSDVVTTTTCNLSTGTWYLAEVNYQASSNYRKIAVYNTSGSEICSTTDSSTAISGFTTDAGMMYLGNPDTTSQFAFVLDNVRISNSYTRNFVALRDTDSWPGD